MIAAYLAGAIPFGYLLVRWLKGIDVRTLGSGNVGATNVGRALGFRFFLLVLAFDALKGFLPTWGVPRLLTATIGSSAVDLPVGLAVAAIVGHSFPIYLGFKGGKGVATSLGSILALDPIASLAAIAVFLVSFAIWRYVSLASLLGGLAFVLDRLFWVGAPFVRENRALTVFSVGILTLLLVRHRANLKRILAGTEPKVNLRKKREIAAGDAPRSGRASTRWIVAAALGVGLLGAVGLILERHARARIEANAGPWNLRECDRALTGLQRIDRITFDRTGSWVAATCPRYERVVIYPVDAQKRLGPVREVELDGRPLAIAATRRGFVVLVQPGGDERHVEPGWIESLDCAGNRVGDRVRTSFYPRDLAVSRDGMRVFVLCAGRTEGDAKKPAPSLETVALAESGAPGRVLDRLEWNDPEPPGRLILSQSGAAALVTLPSAGESLAIDLASAPGPKRLRRLPCAEGDTPFPSDSGEGDWILLPTAVVTPAVGVDLPAGAEGARAPRCDYVLTVREQESVLEIARARPLVPLGSMPLLGALNMGRTRPIDLAIAREQGLVAVATRSGAIHLVELSRRLPEGGMRSPVRDDGVVPAGWLHDGTKAR